MKVIFSMYLVVGLIRSDPDISNPLTYRAAVMEHRLEPYKNTSLETMMANIQVYAKNAAEAARQGAQIIIFPEYGITGFSGNCEGRDFPLQYHQELLQSNDWNPCLEANSDQNVQVVKQLSCMARSNSIAVVANLITGVPCSSQNDSTCPDDDIFYYNTNLIFGSNGTLLGTYHKHHLSNEDFLNSPPQSEIIVVDLGFIRLATFVSTDILLVNPAIQLIQQYGVKNIAMPAYWGDELPFLTSIQTWAGFAYGMGINFLAANLYFPSVASLGSGIYSSRLGALNETYDLARPGRLLIADVPVDPLSIPWAEDQPKTPNPSCRKQKTYADTHFYEYGYTNEPSSEPVGRIHKMWYEDLRTANVVHLNEIRGQPTICQEDVCCSLDYQLDNLDLTNKSSYALLASKVRHNEYHIQVCAVVRCEPSNSRFCGVVPETDTKTRFERLVLRGNFTTPFLFPNVFSTNLEQIATSFWNFTKIQSAEEDNCTFSRQLKLSSQTKQHLLTARILGRDYITDSEEQSGNEF